METYTEESEKQNELEFKAKEKLEEDVASGEQGRGILFQDWEAPDLNELVGKKIGQSHEFELENGSKQTCECTGIVLEVSKDNEWRDNRRARRKFKAGEAAKILWDAITDCGTTIDSEESIVALDPKKWEKMTVVGGWRADVGSIVVEYK